MDLLIKTALTSYQNGETGFMQYLQAIELSNQIVRQYYDDIHAYNLALIEKGIFKFKLIMSFVFARRFFFATKALRHKGFVFVI